jgi:amino acid adenylation domain-containing protein
MTLEFVLDRCAASGLFVELRNGNVVARMSDGSPPPSGLISELRQFRAELKEYLIRRSFVNVVVEDIVVEDGKLASFEQERLFYIDKSEEFRGQYSIVDAFRIVGSIDVYALQRALNILVARHEALHSTFHSDINGSVKLSQTASVVSIEEIHSDGAWSLELATQAVQSAHYCQFDLENGPLLKVTLITWQGRDQLLIFATHHIISDAWSQNILWDELSFLYSEQLHPSGAELPLPGILPSKVSAQQRSQLNDNHIRTLTSFWQSYLSDVPAVHSLPLDMPRDSTPRHQGAEVHCGLDENLTRRVSELAVECCSTTAMALGTAFSILIGRASNQPDVVFGATLADRSGFEDQSVFGFFVKTLVLRQNIDWAFSYRESIRAFRDNWLTVYDNRDLPFDQIVKHSASGYDRRHHPLFQIMYNYVSVGEVTLRLVGVEVSSFPFENPTVTVDLELQVFERKDSIELCWQYDKELFTKPTIERLNACLVELLLGLTEAPDIAIGSIGMLEPRERRALMEFGSGEARPLGELTIVDAFRATCARVPQSIAVSELDHSLSYEELALRVKHLSATLLAQGVTHGSTIGICLPRSINMVVAVMGILQAGCAYVPLEYQGPRERVESIIRDASIRYVVTDRATQGFAKIVEVEIIAIDSLNPQIEARETIVSVDDAAYFLYTSGSTGQPKGVGITHSNVMNYLNWCRDVYLNEAIEVVLFHGPITFDATVTTFLLPLICGIRLKIAPEGEDLITLYQTITEEHALIKFTPAHLIALNAKDLFSSLQAMRSHVFVIGGEVLDWQVVEPWLRSFPDSQFYNEYGPTETTVGSTYFRMTLENAKEGSTSIGRPIANTYLFVVSGGQLQMNGGVGELYIAGAGVGMGYLNLPEVNRTRYVNFSMDAESTMRCYATGDLVSWATDGTLNFWGRADNQIKLNGYRIELEEVRLALQDCTGVSEAHVLFFNHELVAYLTSDDLGSIDLRFVQLDLRGRLPKHMIPAKFSIVEAFPRKPSGKIDFGALSVLPTAKLSDVVIEPQNLFEVVVEKIWRTKLCRPVPVSVESDFFDLGGSSLQTFSLISEVNCQFNSCITLRDFLLKPTIRHLSSLVAANHASTWSPLSAFPVGSPSTESVYLIAGLCGHSVMFHSVAKELSSRFSVFALEHRGLDGLLSPYPTYDEMLNGFFDAILAQSKAGTTVNLCGHSFGAMIARDLACRLEGHGTGVRVVMIDAALETSERGPDAEDSDAFLALELNDSHFSDEAVVGIKAVYQKHIDFESHLEPLHRLQSPLLYIAASSDPRTSADSAETVLAKRYADLFSVVTCRGDHFSILKEPNAITLSSMIGKFFNSENS